MRQIGYLVLIISVIGLATASASIWMVAGAGGFLGAGLALLMLGIAVADYRYLIIPNELSAAALVLALINAAIAEPTSSIESVAVAALRGFITMLLFLAIRTIYGLLRRREGLGLGDVKLAFVAGAWLDWAMIPVAIEIAALAALTGYVLRHMIGKRPVSSTSRLPFGLFFAPSIWVSWLLANVIFGSA